MHENSGKHFLFEHAMLNMSTLKYHVYCLLNRYRGDDDIDDDDDHHHHDFEKKKQRRERKG